MGIVARTYTVKNVGTNTISLLGEGELPTKPSIEIEEIENEGFFKDHLVFGFLIWNYDLVCLLGDDERLKERRDKSEDAVKELAERLGYNEYNFDLDDGAFDWALRDTYVIYSISELTDFDYDKISLFEENGGIFQHSEGKTYREVLPKFYFDIIEICKERKAEFVIIGTA